MKMNNSQWLFPIAVSLLASCGPEPLSPSSELGALRTERDSLIRAKDGINARLMEVDERIADLDTAKRLTLVSSIPVTSGPFAHYFSILAEVHAQHNVLIHPETQGVIERISVQEGDKVQEGQMLFTLDSDIISNSLEEVKGQLELAQVLYQKRKKLWDQNIGSEIEFLQAKNSYESLDARARSLQAQFELSQVRAPFSGYVDEVAAKEGEMAAPGMPVLRLIALDDVYLKGDVSERYLRQVQKGTPVEVYFESLDRRSNSQIDEVSRFIKAENRTFSVRMDLENTDGMLKPNLLAEVRIRDYAAEKAITLPSRVILQSPDGRDYVYLFEAMANGRGKVRRQFIETGVSYEGRTEVLSGLESGLQVIDKGARSVKEGQRVEQSV